MYAMNIKKYLFMEKRGWFVENWVVEWGKETNKSTQDKGFKRMTISKKMRYNHNTR